MRSANRSCSPDVDGGTRDHKGGVRYCPPPVGGRSAAYSTDQEVAGCDE